MSLEDAFEGMPSLQRLIDAGAVWRLDGAVERAARRAIQEGTCVLGPCPTRGRRGVPVPSRHDVPAGAPGSLAYADARRRERGLPPLWAADDPS